MFRCLPIVLVALTACDPQPETTDPGNETGRCVDDRCWSGLKCLSNLCVDPDFDPEELTRVDVDCAALPPVAAGTDVDLRLEITIDDARGPFTVDATTDDPGLTVDPGVLRLHGKPTRAGKLEIPIIVTGDNGLHGRASCRLHVKPRLSFNPVNACLGLGDDPLLLAAGTGDDAPIVCDAPGGLGNGELPDGFTVDPDTCQVDGDPATLPVGVTGVMVRARQSGAEAWIPYCLTAEAQKYEFIQLRPQGPTSPSEPVVASFQPDVPIAVQLPGLRVTAPDLCASDGCAYRYRYAATSSLFDRTDFDEFVVDMESIIEGGQTIGYRHGFPVLGGSPVPPELENRTWVYSATIAYCLAPDGTDCNGDALYDKGETLSIAVFIRD